MKFGKAVWNINLQKRKYINTIYLIKILKKKPRLMTEIVFITLSRSQFINLSKHLLVI